MEIQNNKEQVPFEHYLARWPQLDPQEAAARCGVEFDGAAFGIRLYGVNYRLHWPEFSVEADAPDAIGLTYIPAQILMMRFLLEGKQAGSTCDFLTFRETPWGPVYLVPFTGRCLTRAAFTFGTNIKGFCKAMESLGGKKLGHGDASYEVEALEGYFIRMILWQGDEEFPPSCQILFSDHFPQAFGAEDLCVFCDILISDGKRRMR